MHRVRRLMLLSALVALLAGGAPADAAPRGSVIRDGFTVAGRGGSQVRVRLTKPLTMPGWFGYTRTFSMTASAGPVAGFALVGDRASGWALQSTPRWTCRNGDCGSDARLVDSDVWGGPEFGVLPPGDYVLVLIGAPGAQVQVTAPPVAKGAKPARVWTTRSATPVVEETGSTSAGAPAQHVALGEFRPRRTGPRALVGVVHTVMMVANQHMEYELNVGADSLYGCGRYPRSGSRGSLSVTTYRTQAMLAPTGQYGADPCASWRGVVAGALAEQRGVGLYLPIVL